MLREEPEPEILDLVGVLIFVDEDVFEPMVVLREHLWFCPENVEHVQQQIAEVARI